MEEPIIEDLDMLTELLAEIKSQDPEMRRMADELETKERLESLLYEHPAVYRFFQMVRCGDVEYEHGLEKICVYLIQENEALKDRLGKEQLKKPNNPLPLLGI